MNIKKYVTALFGVLMLATVTPELVRAQWSIGASYEIRQEEPKNGFGVRIERKILTGLPLVQLGIRGHFSYFSEENSVSEGGITYSTDVTNYDYGLAATGGVNLGLLMPYIGLGLGSTTFDVSTQDFPNGDFDTSDSAVFWNTFVGAELSVTPIIKPFVEYRFQQTDEPEFASEFDSNGRMIFGISLSF